ncbi:MAG: hypothetical protein ACREK4_20065 [Candidatus Rokuibacteriota bacterium]
MKRAEGAREVLDGSVAVPELAASLADIDRLNSWFGGYALSLRAIRRLAASVPRDRPLRVVDVGGVLGIVDRAAVMAALVEER